MIYNLPELKQYKNQTIYVVCTGPSLKGYDYSLLKGLNVFAVNDAFRYVPNFEYLVALDFNWYDRNMKDLLKIGGEALTEEGQRPAENPNLNIKKVKRDRFAGLPSEKGVATGNNSGYFALNLAIGLGATTIYLLGMDMGFKKDNYHYGSGFIPQNKKEQDPKKYDIVQRHWDVMESELYKIPHVKIFNASIDSKLEIFTKISLNGIEYN